MKNVEEVDETTFSPEEPLNTGRSPLINRNFALFWSGQIVSKLGDNIFFTILVLWVSIDIVPNQSWKPLAVTGIFLASTIPVAVMGPIAGVFADRWNSRQTLLIMSALSALLTLTLLFTPFLPLYWQLGTIYSIAFGLSVCALFFDPSVFKLINDIVAKEDRARASARMSLLLSVGTVLGPALASLLFFVLGVYVAILFNALSFVVSFFTVLVIHPSESLDEVEESEQHSFWQEFREGFSILFRSRVLTTILIACVLDVTYEGIFNSLGIFYVIQNLAMPASFYGILDTGLGIGLTLGSLLATALAARLNIVKTFWLALLLEGVAVFCCSRLNSPIFTLITLTFGGGAVAFINIAASPIILHATPRKFIGRVYAVLSPTLTLSMLFSGLLAGYLDSTLLSHFHATIVYLSFGPIDTLLSISGLLAIVGGIYGCIMLRDVNIKSAKEASR